MFETVFLACQLSNLQTEKKQQVFYLIVFHAMYGGPFFEGHFLLVCCLHCPCGEWMYRILARAVPSNNQRLPSFVRRRSRPFFVANFFLAPFFYFSVHSFRFVDECVLFFMCRYVHLLCWSKTQSVGREKIALLLRLEDQKEISVFCTKLPLLQKKTLRAHFGRVFHNSAWQTKKKDEKLLVKVVVFFPRRKNQ